MGTVRRFGLIAGIATAVLAAGCGGGSESGPGPTPTIAVAVSPTSLTVEQGSSGTVTLTLTRGGGYTGTVTASVSGLPAGIAVSFSPASLSGSATTSTATVTVAEDVAPGNYTATVKASGSGVGDATGTYVITVTAKPTFTLTPSPADLSIPAGLSGTSTITIARTNFTGAIAMSLDDPPAGITATFDPATIADNTTSTVTISVATSVAPGTYPISVKGTGDAGAKTATINLTVTPEPTYTLSVDPTSVQIAQGAQGTVAVTIARTNFTGAVTLSLDNAPAGVTAIFDPAMPTGTTSTLRLVVDNTASPGIKTLTIKGTAEGVPSAPPVLRAAASGRRIAAAPAAPGERTATLTATVVPALLQVDPGILTVAQGQSGQTTVNVIRVPPFAGSVLLSLEGKPVGVTAAFSPTSVTGGSSTLTLAAGGLAPGDYPITIRGTTGTGGDPQTGLTLRVTPPAGSNISYNFCGTAPAWFAYRDGTSGPFVRLTPTVNGNVQTYSVPITSDLGEIVYAVITTPAVNGIAAIARVIQNTERGPHRALGQELLTQTGPAAITAAAYNTIHLKGTRAELQQQGTCAPTSTFAGLQITSSGQAAGERVAFQLGSGQLLFNNSNTFTGQFVQGAHDWWAVYVPSTGPWPKYFRGVAQSVPGSVSFDRANALPLLAEQVNVTGASGGTFVHRIGLQNWQERVATFTLGGTGATTTMFGFADTRPGDLFVHGYTWTKATGNVTSQIVGNHYFDTFGPQTFALPPEPPTYTLTDLGATNGIPRFRMEGTIPTDYNTTLQAIFTGGNTVGGTSQYFVTVFQGYREAMGITSSYQLEIPDLSGLQYPVGAELVVPLLSSRVVMNGSNVGQVLTGSSFDLTAQLVVTTAVQQ